MRTYERGDYVKVEFAGEAGMPASVPALMRREQQLLRLVSRSRRNASTNAKFQQGVGGGVVRKSEQSTPCTTDFTLRKLQIGGLNVQINRLALTSGSL